MSELIETVKMIDSVALGDLIQDIYGRYYSVGMVEEMGQNHVQSFYVPEEVTPGDREWTGCPTVEAWNTMEPDPYGYTPQPLLQDILNDLHSLGHIPEGKYWVHVWW